MKIKITKILSVALISLAMFSIPVQASTWIPHEGWNDPSTGETLTSGWEYIKDDGTHAAGWEYINWKWYYFDYVDGTATTGLKNIDGNDYFFDPVNCDMKHDQYIKTYEYSAVLSYAESDGHINYDKFTYDDTINKSTWN